MEVLVIDDFMAAAEEYARLIKLKTQLDSFATDDPNIALEMIRTNPIKVIVVDQKMPKVTGTTLYKDILNVDSRIRAIMLTGEAEADEVGEAFRLGFADYLHKSQVEQLPLRVLLQHAKYHEGLIEQHLLERPMPIFSMRKGMPLLGHSISYSVFSMEVIDDEYIFAGSWITIKQINTGEGLKEIDRVEIEERFVHEEIDEGKVSSQFNLSPEMIKGLQLGLERAVSTKFTTNIYASKKEALEVVREYKLPEEPTDPKQLYVVSRHYQRAPVYRQIRCIILRECDCCGSRYPFPLTTYQLTSRIGTRQRDHLSDGSVREIATGVEMYQ